MADPLNGASAVLRTLVNHGVTTCFTNPGTSEMHFVAALDRAPAMRGILTLFEGVATGAADGYGRMRGTPAATLLHLGPGLGNGLANLHNARKARTPIVNIVGDHATSHAAGSPLHSDIPTVAANVSTWVRTATSSRTVATDVAAAVAAATGPPGAVATLILPADISWGPDVEAAAIAVSRTTVHRVDQQELLPIHRSLLAAHRPALLLGGHALQEPHLSRAAAIAVACGARLIIETFPARWQRGAGTPVVERLAYLAEMARVQLADVDCLVLVDAAPPVSFFAYPGKSSQVTAPRCDIHLLAADPADLPSALDDLAGLLGVHDQSVNRYQQARTPRPSGPLTAASACRAIAHAMPDNAIVCDESQTSGATFAARTSGAPPHDWLALTGGAIGHGLPTAVGAAVACPDRPVLVLQADGSAQYTIQALWTMAREDLDVTVIVFNNRAYSILNLELDRVGAGRGGRRARDQMDLSATPIDFVSLAHGYGVPAVRAESTDELIDHLQRAFTESGPHLVEVVIPEVLRGWRRRTTPLLLRNLEHLPLWASRGVLHRLAPDA